MAKGRNDKAQLATEQGPSPQGEKRRHEIQQYQKIVRFEQNVLRRNDQRVQIPTHITPSAQASTHPPNVEIEGDAPVRQMSNFHSFAANAQKAGLPARPFAPPVSHGRPNGQRPFGSGATQINPILLEKSDDLIKAELQLQRQRLERALREEVEGRRVSTKAASQGEPLADFDLSDVLSKALTLVQATAAPLPVDENVTAANQEAASDSFDDNTFYSSRHDTPESNLTSRVRNQSEEVRTPAGKALEQPSKLQNIATPIATNRRDLPGNLDSNPARPYQGYSDTSVNNAGHAAADPPRAGRVTGLSDRVIERVASTGPRRNTSGEQSPSDESGNMDLDQPGVRYGRDARQLPREPYVDNHPPSPLLRAHDLSPIAPQPAHISPLATRRLHRVAELGVNSTTGTPAQVVALRNDLTAVTSPESSPQSGNKKKGKKKKRKADRQAPEPEATPYIKPEPRSPSPMTAPSYIRPNKRQRYAEQQPVDPAYNGVRYEPQAAYVQAQPQAIHIPSGNGMGYERVGAYPQRSASTTVSSFPAYGREYANGRQVVGDQYVIREPLNYVDSNGFISAHGEQLQRPPSQVRVSDPYGQPPRSYRVYDEAPRMSIRPEGDAFIGPPRQPPTRIVVDAFGREYIDPPRTAAARPSVAPPPRLSDPEIVYERPAPRAITRHAGPVSYEEAGAVYRRASPPYGAMPRRVVTQPEYVSQDYRDNRQREYSTRPLGPPGEFVEVMAPPERRHLQEGPREFVARAASVRPVEPARYEIPHDYGRVQSVRPEAAVQPYASSAHAAGRREAAQPYMREYGVRPVEHQVVRPEYNMRPVEHYYTQQIPGGEEYTYVDRPRGGTQDVVYADDTRREIYR
ncbi:hypothetical protein G7046_g5424 [Stylonectria norvegica]|nr:hypothetical protein G7046_g5424 [Stylonectria norvegica]